VEHDKVGELNQNQTVPVLGCNQDRSWLLVDAGERSGWVSAKYMAVSVPLDALSIVAAAPTAAPETSAPQREVATVLGIIDGDTIEVQIGDAVYTVRYMGIDSPEVQHPESSMQSMARDAAAANEALVGGKVVELEKDVSEVDWHFRLLRYVWIGDVMVNAELVRQGYAQAVAYPPDVKYADLFTELQREAIEAGRGLWESTPKAPPP
jgi:endonuclease YncB( thermonuclease family)